MDILIEKERVFSEEKERKNKEMLDANKPILLYGNCCFNGIKGREKENCDSQ